LIRIRSLDSSNNPKTRRVYSLTFIVDIEEKKKNIKVNNNKIKVNFYSKNKRWFYKLDGCSIYSLTLT